MPDPAPVITPIVLRSIFIPISSHQVFLGWSRTEDDFTRLAGVVQLFVANPKIPFTQKGLIYANVDIN